MLGFSTSRRDQLTGFAVVLWMGTFVLGIIAALLCAPGMAEEVERVTAEQRAYFENRIRPVLVQHCYECHSHETDTLSADYALDSPDGLRSGGASGEAAVVAGQPNESRLLLALRYANEDLQMPPDAKLPDSVIGDFEQWIAMGAPDPRTEDSDQLRQRAQMAAAGTLWSFQPIAKPTLPRVQDKQWPRSAIDHYVLARLERENLKPVADADPRKLVRRVYFDLVGLPPAPEVVAAFVADPSAMALERIVDRLLQSPRFGERWGRHWLDLARYAESSGMEFNFTYPHAWPYRDYVIDSLNEDKPYDRFVMEQIAGDLLPFSSKQQRNENRLATGFLAIGPKRHNAGTTDFRADIVDDQIRTTSEAFLGLTVGCARCHDHKFDPISAKDYYALAGIFHSTDTLHGTTKIKYSRHPSELIPFGNDAEARHKRYQAYRDQVEELNKKVDKKEKELTEQKGDEKQATQQAIESLKKQIKQLDSESPQPPLYGMGVTEGKVTESHVAIGGNPRKKGDQVPRGFLSSVPVTQLADIPEDVSGRLQLARWIISPDNPLTARVMVNRVWQHLFGRGLVASVNNFGVLGEPPSHPQLLDYLAASFQEEGWSVKRLIRKLVLSRTYQLSTRKDPYNHRADPQNRLLWRMTPRRLEVEPLRDALLAISGQLDLARPQGSTVTPLGLQLARRVAWEKLNPPSNHRTVYLPVVRHYAAHMLQEFDFAASSLVVGRRAETTTAQQALFFLNNQFVLKQANATAKRLIQRHPDNESQQLRRAYWRIVARPPTAAELSRAREFLARTRQTLQEDYEHDSERHAVALASFVQTLFGSAEFRYLIHAPPTDQSPQPVLTKAG